MVINDRAKKDYWEMFPSLKKIMFYVNVKNVTIQALGSPELCIQNFTKSIYF